MAIPDPFAEYEKAALLKEIISASNVPSQTLAAVVRDLQIHPSWEDIRLPAGRTMRQCQSVFFDIVPSPRPYQQQLPADPRAQPAFMPPPRQQPMPPEASMTGVRSIQPRPPNMGPFSSESPSSQYSPTSSEAAGRRRGRPNREEAARRKREKEAAAARGEKDPYPTRPRKKPKTEQAQATTSATSAEPSETLFAAPAYPSATVAPGTAVTAHPPSAPYAPPPTSEGLTLAPILHEPSGGFSRTRSDRPNPAQIYPSATIPPPVNTPRPTSGPTYGRPNPSLPPEQPQTRSIHRSPRQEPQGPPPPTSRAHSEAETSQQNQPATTGGEPMVQ